MKIPTNIQELLPALSVALADFAKVRLEDIYTRLFGTKTGESIKRFEPGVKKLVEAILYSSHGLLAGKIDPKTSFGKFIFEIVDDLPAEFGRRMLNGDLKPSIHGINQTGTAARTPKSTIFDLDADKMKGLADWYATASEEERDFVRKSVRDGSLANLEYFIAQDAQARVMILDLSEANRPSPLLKIWEVIAKQFKESGELIGEANKAIDARRRQLREERLGRRSR